MKRATTLLLVLGALLLVVVSFLFLIKPKMDEVAALEVEAEDIRAQQAQVETQIRALEEVRATSPNLEAELAAVGAIVPDNPSLPATLRQLQVAADDSGLTLVSVAPGAPAAVGSTEVPDLASIPLSLSLEGGYFQVVDFLRRIEDPRLTARGILVQDVSVSPAEYPTLAVTVSGTMFSVLEQPVTAPEPTPTETVSEEDDADVEVDVTVTEEATS